MEMLELREYTLSLLSKGIIKVINNSFTEKKVNYLYIDVFEFIAELLLNSKLSYEVDDILKKHLYNNKMVKYDEDNWEDIDTELYENECFDIIFYEYDFCEYIISILIYEIQKQNYVVYSENMIFKDRKIEKGVIAVTTNYPKKILN